jgi:hypothetical protein
MGIRRRHHRPPGGSHAVEVVERDLVGVQAPGNRGPIEAEVVSNGVKD